MGRLQSVFGSDLSWRRGGTQTWDRTNGPYKLWVIEHLSWKQEEGAVMSFYAVPTSDVEIELIVGGISVEHAVQDTFCLFYSGNKQDW